MAQGQVTVKIPSIDQLVKALGTERIEQGMEGAGSAVVAKIKQSWLRGTGGEGTTLQEPKISDPYRKWKEKNAGGRSKIDFNGTTTDLVKSFKVVSVEGTTAIISFTQAEQLEKARGLMNPKYANAAKWRTRPQGMEVGKKLTKIASDFFNKWLRKVVNFQ